VVTVNRAENKISLFGFLLKFVLELLNFNLDDLIIESVLDLFKVDADVRHSERHESSVVFNAEDAALSKLLAHIKHPGDGRVKVARILKQME